MMTPIEKGFQMPPEWYRHERCWMAWPCHVETWEKIGLDKAKKAYSTVAKAIAEFEPVTMIVNPEDVQEVVEVCGDKVKVFPLAINDSWTRDTGPTFLLNKQGELAGVDWIHNAWGGNYENFELDNQIAKAVIKEVNADYFHAPLVMEGGSFHVDGLGTVLTSRECLLNPNRNPHLIQAEIEQYLKDYLGAKRFIWLNKGLLGDETDGHIDEIACFIAPGKVLTLITEDKEDPNYFTLHENLEILKNATDASDQRLEVYTIEQPPATYMHNERLTLSYINFYLANKGIVMPAFGYEKYDQKAYMLFKQLFPQHKISQIEAIDVFAGGGGIHCITQQQPMSAKGKSGP